VKKSFKALLLISALVLTLDSCASLKKIEEADTATGKVFVTNTKTIHILQPEYISEPVDSLFMFNAEFGDESFSVLSYLQADNSGIYIELMNDFGTSMGSITYEESSADLNCSFIPEKLKAEYIINDLQFVFYQSETLKKNYAGNRLIFTEEKNSETGTITRNLYSGKQLVESAVVSETEIRIQNFYRNYTYTLSMAGL